jgi:Fe-S-cluster containining protein
LRVRCLSFHAAYRCGNSGVCCSSGWAIPVEPQSERRIGDGLRSGRLRLSDHDDTIDSGGRVPGPHAGEHGAIAWSRPAPEPTHDTRVVLKTDAVGGCIFLDTRKSRVCVVHQQLGEGALPSACRHFPRVVTLTPLGVSVSLSHYCPTAASLLFGRSAVPRIVANPLAFPSSWPFEGLDATQALPPLLRPGVLMSWPALERWEEHAVATLADESLTAEAALAGLAADAEAARAWASAEGDFDAFFARLLAARAKSRVGAGAVCGSEGADAAAWDLAAAAVPEPALRPTSPGAARDPSARALVDAGWSTLAWPVRRWLASKAFASWTALQGQGLRTTVRGLALALAVLRAEAARGCARSAVPLDAESLREAIRRADLLLLQLVDPQALAERLSAVEHDRAAC